MDIVGVARCVRIQQLKMPGTPVSTQAPPALRHVRGALFSDYVRMLRRCKDVDWAGILPPIDIEYLHQHIESNSWYPMPTFERMGVAILEYVPGATLNSVRLWGRYSVTELVQQHPELVVEGDPVESLMRLRVMRATLFDFPAFNIPMLSHGHSHIDANYRMGPVAEEAACYQTMGFCEGVVALAGGGDVTGEFVQRRWVGNATTLISLEWNEE